MGILKDSYKKQNHSRSQKETHNNKETRNKQEAHNSKTIQNKIRNYIIGIMGLSIIGGHIAVKNIDFSELNPFNNDDKSSEVEKQPKLKLKS